MEDTNILSTSDVRVHSSFGSQRPGSRDPVRVESRLPRPTLPHRPEVSEMMDVEPDGGESEIVCSGQIARLLAVVMSQLTHRDSGGRHGTSSRAPNQSVVVGLIPQPLTITHRLS